MPKVWPVEFKLLNGWSLQLFSWSIDISIYAIQKNIKVKLLEHQMDENNLFTNANTSMKNPNYFEVNYSQYRYEY